ncbi:hypothetical protein N8I71_13190 [Roseibacterium sp. SDUM158016]|uniref:hypothetical protein n=1 Tax=Roseicyclus sediminis TaxID=2980997 RepID=UPI0021D0B883|nr:hypothetical protein [Roseibacterium sp. SDUM158016]MCU4653793.1 hypothetical protein [Roseibacterium sp. SDUM158016]
MARRLFLERRTYRKNRLQDAARLLPVLGMILFFGPVFIGGEEGQGAGLAEWLVYCFVVWLGLIAVTMLVSRALAEDPPDTASGTASAEAGADMPGPEPRA